MWDGFRSLRARLTIACTLIVGVTVAVFAVAVWIGEPTPERMRLALLVAAPVAAALAGLTAWWIARRMLAPIRIITQEADDWSVDRLDRRIPVPAGHGEMARLARTVNRMLDRLEAAMAAQERFVANAAHEFRTPVAALLGEAQVMAQRARTEEEYARFVTSVQDEMRRLGQLVHSLLTLARADAGVPPAANVPVSVNEVVTDAVQACALSARQREIRLVTRLALPAPDEPEVLVHGEADLLRAMVTNLVQNAVRFSPVEQAVDVLVTAHEVDVEVRVRDRGPGLPPEHLPHVFERFYSVTRGDGTGQGVGLGLAIAAGVARLHGGEIAVTNCPDAGCEFVVHLPRFAPDG
jgi:signal transduction histidine kinase